LLVPTISFLTCTLPFAVVFTILSFAADVVIPVMSYVSLPVLITAPVSASGISVCNTPPPV
jgi:hypothetical protein